MYGPQHSVLGKITKRRSVDISDLFITYTEYHRVANNKSIIGEGWGVGKVRILCFEDRLSLHI